MPFLRNLKKRLTKHLLSRTDTPYTGAYNTTRRANPMGSTHGDDTPSRNNDPITPHPTTAAFSPNQQTTSQRRGQRSVLIHQKSPLLVSTPPQITRTLAYSHPYILPLERLAALVAWRSGDAWESFLLLSVFWGGVLYLDDLMRWAGPVVVVGVMVVGLYTRRYSPLSSTTWSDGGGRGKRGRADSGSRGQSRKSLDDILNTLQRFTAHCEICIEPFRQLSEFLSTQSTPTEATTRPALTTLFVRVLAFTPVWIALTLPPLRIITTQRIVLVLGTAGLSWHSRYAQVCRSILWRSRTVRWGIELLTGLDLSKSAAVDGGSGRKNAPPLPPRRKDMVAAAVKGKSPGVRFTFTIYENERRWLGLGWSKQMFPYERQAWTDDHLDECPEPTSYSLPETENDGTKWRWVGGSSWHVEGMVVDRENSAKRIGGGGGGDESGWTYCDGKWQDARKVDGWSRYTRRRKWIRDAELVEVDAPDEDTPSANSNDIPTTTSPNGAGGDATAETSSIDTAAARKRGWGFKRSKSGKVPIMSPDGDAISGTWSQESRRSRDSVEDDIATPLERIRQYEWDRAYNEDMAPQFG